jgi:hypothetical protein
MPRRTSVLLTRDLPFLHGKSQWVAYDAYIGLGGSGAKPNFRDQCCAYAQQSFVLAPVSIKDPKYNAKSVIEVKKMVC